VQGRKFSRTGHWLEKPIVIFRLLLRMTVRNQETGATAFSSGGARFQFCDVLPASLVAVFVSGNK
jgi:hypothetical protein